MNYMVMETHPGYAVVLDEQGGFSKVANLRYQVGQTVTDVVPLNLPEAAVIPVKQNRRRWVRTLTALAACLILVLSTVLFGGSTPCASVYMTINPQVRIDVDKKDVVVGLAGVNEDGLTLIEGYSFRNKDLDTVVDELVDRAVSMGFLKEGGTITLDLDADETWVASHKNHLESHVQEHLKNQMEVTVAVGRCDDEDHHEDHEEENHETDHHGDEDHEDEDHEEENHETDDHGEEDHEADDHETDAQDADSHEDADHDHHHEED